jgi:hypothetical protein
MDDDDDDMPRTLRKPLLSEGGDTDELDSSDYDRPLERQRPGRAARFWKGFKLYVP